MSKQELAPVVVFCFRRLSELEITISNLSNNYLAKDTILYVFSDGPRDNKDVQDVNDVRAYLRTITSFKNVIIREHSDNQGLSRSVINGVSLVLEKYGKIIVVEDDLVTSPNFLDFMNQALCFYEANKSVLSISGYTLPLKNMPVTEDFYSGIRASSWGWGTWQSRWQDVDWDVSDFDAFYKSRDSRRDFNRGGSDMSKMLKDQIDGRIDSWAVRFAYHQYRRKMLTIFPTLSKVMSIGFGSDATHTFSATRFRTDLDVGNIRSFSFSNDINVDSKLASDFRYFFSLRVRISHRLQIYVNNFKSWLLSLL